MTCVVCFIFISCYVNVTRRNSICIHKAVKTTHAINHAFVPGTTNKDTG